MSKIKLVYQGLTDRDKELRMRPRKLRRADLERKDCIDGALFPMAPGKEDFYIQKQRDTDGDKKRKAARRKRYLEDQKTTLEEKLKDLDSVREVAGFVFEKGVPLEINMGSVEKGEKAKLNTFIEMGILEEVKEEKPEPKPEPKPEEKVEEKPVQQQTNGPKKPGRPKGS